MSNTSINVGEQLYAAKVNFTGLTEFGFSMDELSSGEKAPPPEGARFDIAFQGKAFGPRLKGDITGVDYLNVRADGRFELHIHAVLNTEDGENIAFFADGVAMPRENSSLLDLRENVTLTTSSKIYTWVNQLQVWG